MLTPTRDDYIAQIEADLQAPDANKKALKERLKLVKAADEESAREVYMGHIEATQTAYRDAPEEA